MAAPNQNQNQGHTQLAPSTVQTQVENIITRAIDTIQSQIIAIHTQEPSVQESLPADVRFHIQNLQKENRALLSERTPSSDLQQAHKTLTKSHQELSQAYRNLQQEFNTLREDHNLLAINYSSLQTSWNDFYKANDAHRIRHEETEKKLHQTEAYAEDCRRRHDALAADWLSYNQKIEQSHKNTVDEKNRLKAVVDVMYNPQSVYYQTVKGAVEELAKSREKGEFNFEFGLLPLLTIGVLIYRTDEATTSN